MQDSVLKVNWAFQSTSTASAREETASHFTIFVGDLATEIDDEKLHAAFSNYLSISDARIMWDMTTGRSRGYGFVSFRERSDAELAIDHMNGAQLGSRNIRTNWAKTKQSTPTTPAAIVGPSSATIAPMSYQQLTVTQQYSLVLNQAAPNACTIYIGNLAADTTQADLDPLFGVYGDAEEIRLHVDRGFAFAKLKTHDVAALAIVQLAGVIVKGRPIKCSCMPSSMSVTDHRAMQIGCQWKAKIVVECAAVRVASLHEGSSEALLVHTRGHHTARTGRDPSLSASTKACSNHQPDCSDPGIAIADNCMKQNYIALAWAQALFIVMVILLLNTFILFSSLSHLATPKKIDL